MIAWLIPMVAALLVTGLVWEDKEAQKGLAGLSDHPMAPAIREAEQYRAFAYWASQYAAAATPPTTRTSRTWAQMQAAGVLPPMAAHLNFPPTWRIVQEGSQWVLCAPMNVEGAVTYLTWAAHRATPGPAHTVGTYRVLNATDASEAQTLSTWCV
jgi:hypothetical protein